MLSQWNRIFFVSPVLAPDGTCHGDGVELLVLDDVAESENSSRSGAGVQWGWRKKLEPFQSV